MSEAPRRTPDIELRTLLLCDYAMTAQDGKISAVGIFSQINVARVPATHGRAFIVAVLEAAPGEHELTITILGPSGRPIIERPPQMRISVPPNATTANIVANLRGMRLAEIGRHRIEIRSGDRVLGSSPFLVNLVMPSPQPGTA